MIVELQLNLPGIEKVHLKILVVTVRLHIDEPQAAAEAAGNILQPADHKGAERRSDITRRVDHRDADCSGAQAD